MGGNALNKVITTRKTTEEYNIIASKLIPIIEKGLSTDISLVKSYFTKDTHGDMDLLIKITEEFHNSGIELAKFVEETFNPGQIYNNGSVISFDYDEFQIDLIPVKAKFWDVSNGYYSYDPTGNLMGKIAYKYGLKYGFNGLIYPYRNFNGKLSTNILLSNDNAEIFNFLGYDYSEFSKGFETLEDIFKYIINGKYFDSSMFDLDKLRNKDRQRNKKRKTYNEFLSYIKENNIVSEYNFDRDKSTYLDFIETTFPDVHFKDKLETLSKKNAENQLMRDKFNGKIIMEHYSSLKGEELGRVMGNFMKSFDDYSGFILKNTTEQILDVFDDYYSENK